MTRLGRLLFLILAVTPRLADASHADDLTAQRLYRLSSDLQGANFHCMAVDSQGNAYFITSEPDTVTDVPIESSARPFWSYLVAYSEESGSFQTVAAGIPLPQKAVFDLHDHLWLMTSTALFRWTGATAEEMLSAADGHFEAIAADSSGAVWSSRRPKGLYCLQADGTATYYPSMTGQLLDYGALAIHASAQQDVWLALCRGVVRMRSGTWDYHELPSRYTASQNPSCLTTDKTGQLWVGMGGERSGHSLLRFDGQDWYPSNPEKLDGTELSGATICELQSDGENLWVVASEPVAGKRVFHVLRTFDGADWAELPGVEGAIEVYQMAIDRIHRAVWIATTEVEESATQGILRRYSY